MTQAVAPRVGVASWH